MTNIFEQASRQNLRFPIKGQVPTEWLWGMTKEELSDLSVLLHKGRKGAEGSLLKTKSKSEEITELQIAIASYIFNVKEFEELAQRSEADRADRKKKLLEILARKQDASLESKSEDELLALIDSV